MYLIREGEIERWVSAPWEIYGLYLRKRLFVLFEKARNDKTIQRYYINDKKQM